VEMFRIWVSNSLPGIRSEVLRLRRLLLETSHLRYICSIHCTLYGSISKSRIISGLLEDNHTHITVA